MSFHPEKLIIPEIIARCDELAAAGKRDALGDFLRENLTRAEYYGDESAQLSLLNEIMGFYRMAGDDSAALAAADRAEILLKKLDLENTVTGGTILLNCATVKQAAGEIDDSLAYYQRAYRCYALNLPPDDRKFAGLLNNTAGAYSAAGDREMARAYYLEALDILLTCGDMADTAVTCINLAQLAPPYSEEAEKYLDEAISYLNSPMVCRDGYYAHTCSKCIPALKNYGRMEEAEMLTERMEKIYAGN